MKFGSGDAELIRCHIDDNHANNGGGVYSSNGNLLVTHSQINHNDSEYHGGGVYCKGGTAVFSNCVLWGNASDMSGEIRQGKTGGGAIHTKDVDDLRIGNCTFYKNSSRGGGEALLYESDVARAYTIHNSILWDTHDSEVARYGEVSSISFSHCCIKGDWDRSEHPDMKSINKDPMFTDAPDDLTLYAGSPCIDAGSNELVLADSADQDGDGNTNEKVPIDLGDNARFVDDPFTTDMGDGAAPVVDIGAYEFQEGWPGGACIIYVDDSATGGDHGTSWQQAFRYLQDALAIAREGCEIRVAQGTYRPDQDKDHPQGTRDRDATFELPNGVRLKGGYAGVGAPDPNDRDPEAYATILSGDLSENDSGLTITQLLDSPRRGDNSRHVVSCRGAVDLDGFTIEGGNANGDAARTTVGERNGGGMLNRDAAPSISRCIFRHNSATTSGGAMCNWSASAFTNVTRCSFIENYSATQGGAIWNGGEHLVIIDRCTFSANRGKTGGAIENWAPCTIEDCTFDDNFAEDDGGAIMNLQVGGGVDVDITRCQFLNNAASQGGGICNDGTTQVYIRYCTFRENRARVEGGGALCSRKGSRPLVESCIFYGNRARFGGAINNVEISHSQVNNCTFLSNWAREDAPFGLGAGIANDSSDPVVTNCTFWGNYARRGHALYNYKSNPQVANCILWDASEPQIVDDQSTSLVTYSNVSPLWPGEGNISKDPLFASIQGPDGISGTSDDVRLSAGSPCTDAGDNTAVPGDLYDRDGDGNRGEPYPLDLAGNPRFAENCAGRNTGKGDPPIVDMGAYEVQGQQGIAYVDDTAPGADNGSSWHDAYRSLQVALAATGPGCEIRVAQGLYTPTSIRSPLARNATFRLVNGVKLLGGYAGYGASDPDERDIQAYTTFLSGNVGAVDNQEDNCYTVVSSSHCDAGTILDGFTITDGQANGTNIQVVDQHTAGGGMHNEESDLTVRNCTFSHNTATWGGGVFNTRSDPVFEDCTFILNHADMGGGMDNSISEPELIRCHFTENSAVGDGGGLSLDYAWSRLTDCRFVLNFAARGGAIASTSDPIVTDCVFGQNQATEEGGALRISGGEPQLINCALIGNRSDKQGGALFCQNGAEPTLINCTFTDNEAVQGGGIYNKGMGTNTKITNSILWGDTPNEVSLEAPAAATIEYSDIQGGWLPDVMNLDTNPIFVDADGRLSGVSACIDAGNPSALPSDVTTDLDGNPRVVYDKVDMGAYEFQGY